MPAVDGKKPFEIALGLNHAFAARESPARRQAMNMGINRKRRHAKGLHHDHTCGFVTDPRQGFQRLETSRHLTAVVVQENARKPMNGLRFRRGEPARPDNLANLVNGKPTLKTVYGKIEIAKTYISGKETEIS